MEIEGIRACVTGPFTLSSAILLKPGGSMLVDSMVKEKRWVTEVMTNYVAQVVREASKRGADLVIVDEPILSVMVTPDMIMFGYSREEVRYVLNTLFEGVRATYRGFHVCNVLPRGLPEILLGVENANVLDHEHYDSPENFGAYSRDELDAHEKFIGVGVVSSKDARVEGAEEIKTLVNRGMKAFGDRLLFVKPDCGFLGLRGSLGDELEEYQIAVKKLRRIVEVVKDLKEEIKR